MCPKGVVYCSGTIIFTFFGRKMLRLKFFIFIFQTCRICVHTTIDQTLAGLDRFENYRDKNVKLLKVDKFIDWPTIIFIKITIFNYKPKNANFFVTFHTGE